MALCRTNINYYGQYYGYGEYYYTRAKGTGLQQNSNYIYVISRTVSGVWDYIRAKCTRVNVTKDTDGFWKEIEIESPYIYSKVQSLLADYAGYKVRVKAKNTAGEEAVLEGQEAV